MTMLGKRYAMDISAMKEASLTEYYRQECLRSLYATQQMTAFGQRVGSPTALNKGVSFATQPEIIGCADPTVDRSPIEVSPISKMELLHLLSERTFPSLVHA